MWGVGAVLSRSWSLSGDKAVRGELLPWLLLCILNCLVYLRFYFYLQTVHLFGIVLNSLPADPPFCSLPCPSQHCHLPPTLPHSPASSILPSALLVPQGSKWSLPRALSLSAPHFSSSAGMLPVCTPSSCQPELCMSDSLPSCGYGPGL